MRLNDFKEDIDGLQKMDLVLAVTDSDFSSTANGGSRPRKVTGCLRSMGMIVQEAVLSVMSLRFEPGLQIDSQGAQQLGEFRIVVG
ncbi:hypothetical protein PCCS19_28070 [Paenibacillus sp. CCS19]|nr:hypothetical protein PCCS19_28070 [Paenibacillus cellulosilyticus]